MLQDFSWQNLVDSVSGALSSIGDAIAPEGLFLRDAMDRLVRELSRREARVRLEFAERFQTFSAPETVGTFRETFRARPGTDR